jgi:homocitrate synthase NifV
MAAHDAVGPERCLSLVIVRDRQQVVTALDEAVRLGCRSVMLSIPTSAEHAHLKLASASTKYLISVARAAIMAAKDRGFHVTFSGEDGGRTERGRLVDYVTAGFEAGAERFRLAETVAYLAPWQMYDQISAIAGMEGAEIEIHSHNMLGMAVANSLAAYEAGADWISATVSGIGERGGNAPLAEILTSLRILYGDGRYDLTHLTSLTAAVLDTQATGLRDGFMSGPTTNYAFAYELPGQLTHPAAYETIAPEAVGNRRHLRVRSRVSPPLIEVALAGTGIEIDTSAFCAWLVQRQEREGNLPLDAETIRTLAAGFTGDE